MKPLPVEPAWRLAERAPELRWLVTHLWSQDAVGIVGGEPKCCKSFLALDLAVAVAAGRQKRGPQTRPLALQAKGNFAQSGRELQISFSNIFAEFCGLTRTPLAVTIDATVNDGLDCWIASAARRLDEVA